MRNKINTHSKQTVSDNIVTHEETTAEERQLSFTKMMEVALGVAHLYD